MAEVAAEIGEKRTPLTDYELTFLKGVAHEKLDELTDATSDVEVLKHFADVWWNLCLWEKQRADVLDGKAQALLGLASISSAVVTAAAAAMPSASGIGWWLRIGAVLGFLVAAAFAVWSMRLRDYKGFLDTDVFGALDIKPGADVLPKFKVTGRQVAYLRDISMQRWLVYNSFKDQSAEKATRIIIGQVVALISIVWLVLAIVLGK